jgi:hypothetical protein
MTVALPIARTTELHQGVVDDVSLLRSVQVRLGKRLLELRRIDRFGAFQTTTFSLYCEQVGLSASEGRSLADLAEASEKRPSLVDAVLERGITLSQAGMVAEVDRRPELLRPGEDWLRMASQGTTADLRRWLDRRKEEVRSGRPVTSLEVALTDRADVLFRRCRDLVSRSVGSMVTPGQALETVCDDYLERHDPERKADRLKARDEEAKASLKGSGPEPSWVDGRRVAPSALAKRTLLRRAGDRCWVKGCGERVFLQRAHIHPVRAGGSNDPGNQFQGCWEHHKQHDSGEWFLRTRVDGTVVMIDKRGANVGHLIDPEMVPEDERPPP